MKAFLFVSSLCLATVAPAMAATCAADCNEGEGFCEGFTDEYGFVNEGTCVYINKDYNGHDCPTLCPVRCAETETKCNGVGVDATGCPMQDTCVPMGPMDDWGYPCPGSCPVECLSKDEIKCPNVEDEDYRGCPMPDTCHRIPTGLNGNKCAAWCPFACGKNMISCDGDIDWNGCPFPNSCHPIYKDMYGYPCEQQCPPTCGPDEVLCGEGVLDAMNCPVQPYCETPPKGLDGEPCPLNCLGTQASCGEGQVSCPYGMDENNCDMGSYCSPIDVGCATTTAAP